tara:strand:+ start:294 stop:467 length:174 start_codon:yes stop_codon:yes gene_type:complete
MNPKSAREWGTLVKMSRARSVYSPYLRKIIVNDTKSIDRIINIKINYFFHLNIKFKK